VDLKKKQSEYSVQLDAQPDTTIFKFLISLCNALILFSRRSIFKNRTLTAVALYKMF